MVLGSFKVGDNVKIGAGSVVLKPVPPNSTVVGVPGKVVIRDGINIADRDLTIDLDHNLLPDPVAEMFICLQRKVQRLEDRLREVEMKENGHQDL